MPEVTPNCSVPRPAPRQRTLGLLSRWSWRLAKWSCLLLTLYIGILIVGLLPVNRSFQPAESGVTIYVISNEVHADVIVPRHNELHDWTSEFQDAQFAGDISGQSHIAFGWGDRGFYLQS